MESIIIKLNKDEKISKVYVNGLRQSDEDYKIKKGKIEFYPGITLDGQNIIILESSRSIRI